MKPDSRISATPNRGLGVIRKSRRELVSLLSIYASDCRGTGQGRPAGARMPTFGSTVGSAAVSSVSVEFPPMFSIRLMQQRDIQIGRASCRERAEISVVAV